MFANHKEFEIAFKASIDPTWFPLNILWNYVQTGDEVTGTIALYEWLSSKSSKKSPKEIKKPNGVGGGAIVKVKQDFGIAFKIFRNAAGETVIPYRNSIPMRNCLVELANYFVFKTFIPPHFLPSVKTLFFKADNNGYQIGYTMEALLPWNGFSDFETIANFFDVQDVLAKRGIILVHGDLKNDNIMVHKATGGLKIIDFGFSMYHITFEEHESPTIFNVGYNQKFTAPNCRHVDLLLFAKCINSPVHKPPGFYHDYIYNMPTFESFDWRKSKNTVLKKLLDHEVGEKDKKNERTCCLGIFGW